jgi:hypothetical protein
MPLWTQLVLSNDIFEIIQIHLYCHLVFDLRGGGLSLTLESHVKSDAGIYLYSPCAI